MLKKFAALGIEAKIVFANVEGQLLFEKNNHRKDNADRLCKYGCKCCARCVHVQTGNQNEVADDVDDTCDEDEQERRFAVAKSAENRRQKVVGDDEEKYRCRRYEHNLWSE